MSTRPDLLLLKFGYATPAPATPSGAVLPLPHRYAGFGNHIGSRESRGFRVRERPGFSLFRSRPPRYGDLPKGRQATRPGSPPVHEYVGHGRFLGGGSAIGPWFSNKRRKASRVDGGWTGEGVGWQKLWRRPNGPSLRVKRETGIGRRCFYKGTLQGHQQVKMKGNSRIRVRGIDPPLIHSIPAADSTSSDGRVVEKKNMDYLNLLMHKMESCEQGPKRASFSPLKTFTRSNGGGQDPYFCSGIQRKKVTK